MIQTRVTSAGLPVKEYLHPVSLGALAILALNDHWLKGAGLFPGWLTGKLSDVAGMIFFPLLLTAAWNTGLCVWHMATKRPGTGTLKTPQLTRTQLTVAIILSGLALTLLQISPFAIGIYEAGLHALGFGVQVTRDLTDLLALPALIIPWKIGINTIAQYEDNAHLSAQSAACR